MNRKTPFFKAQTIDFLIENDFFNEAGELIYFEPTFTNHRIISIVDNKVCYTQNNTHNFYTTANLQEDITDLLNVGGTYDFLAIKSNAQLRNGTEGKGSIIWIAARCNSTKKIITHLELGGPLKPIDRPTPSILKF